MTRGTFIAADGTRLYTGEREDKPQLEGNGNTFIEGEPPAIERTEENRFDDYVWDSNANDWVLVPNKNKPPDRTARQRVDTAVTASDEAYLSFKRGLDQENRLLTLEGKPTLTEEQYKQLLATDISSRTVNGGGGR